MRRVDGLLALLEAPVLLPQRGLRLRVGTSAEPGAGLRLRGSLVRVALAGRLSSSLAFLGLPPRLRGSAQVRPLGLIRLGGLFGGRPVRFGSRR